MNESRFNSCCDGCYYGTGCTAGYMTESGGELRWKGETRSSNRKKKMPNPTKKDLKDPLFQAIWQTIKDWDINVPTHYSGYCGANGSHAKLILKAIQRSSSRDKGRS